MLFRTPRPAPPPNPAPPLAPSLSLAHLSPAATRASGLLEVCVLFSHRRSGGLRPGLLRSTRGPAGVARCHGLAREGCPAGTDPQTHTGAERRGGAGRAPVYVTGRDANVATSAPGRPKPLPWGGGVGCRLTVQPCFSVRALGSLQLPPAAPLSLPNPRSALITTQRT